MNRRLVIFTIIATVVLGFFFIGLTALGRRGKTAVEFIVVPGDSTIKLNGKKISGKTAYLQPGHYKAEASKSGFLSSTKEFDAPVTTGPITFPLTPQSNEAAVWAQKNANEYLQIEKIVGENAQNLGLNTDKNNPILDKLPYDSEIYSLNYSIDKDNNVTVVVTTATALGRQVAIEKIRSWGYDPTDYKIQFENFTNPFGVKQ